jgi:hypothetical protein
MIKSLGILIGGVFVGAVGIEIIHRKYPDALDKMCTKTREMTSGIKEAFENGYKNATRPEAAPSA